METRLARVGPKWEAAQPQQRVELDDSGMDVMKNSEVRSLLGTIRFGGVGGAKRGVCDLRGGMHCAKKETLAPG